MQTHTHGDPGTASPLHWDLELQRVREVSTEDKGSIEEELAVLTVSGSSGGGVGVMKWEMSERRERRQAGVGRAVKRDEAVTANCHLVPRDAR